MKLSYDELRMIHRRERNSSRLTEVSEDFYSQIEEFLSEENKRYQQELKEDFSLSKAKAFADLKRMTEEILALREKKVLSYALASSRTQEAREEALALPEKKFYEKIKGLLEENRKILEAVVSFKTGSKEKKELNAMKVKMLKEVPSFIGADMKEYGPYSEGQEVSLPYKIAKLFLTRKLAGGIE